MCNDDSKFDSNKEIPGLTEFLNRHPVPKEEEAGEHVSRDRPIRRRGLKNPDVLRIIKTALDAQGKGVQVIHI